MFSKPSYCSPKYKPECCIFLLAGNSPFSQRKHMSSRSTRVRRRNGFRRVLKQSTFRITTTARETRIVSSVSRAQRLKPLTVFLHSSFCGRLLKLSKWPGNGIIPQPLYYLGGFSTALMYLDGYM